MLYSPTACKSARFPSIPVPPLLQLSLGIPADSAHSTAPRGPRSAFTETTDPAVTRSDNYQRALKTPSQREHFSSLHHHTSPLSCPVESRLSSSEHGVRAQASGRRYGDNHRAAAPFKTAAAGAFRAPPPAGAPPPQTADQSASRR